MSTLADKVRRLNLSTTKLPPLILMTDSVKLPDPHKAVASLPKGSAVILRHYNDPNRQNLAKSLVSLCKQKGLFLLIAQDARLARAMGAHGLHLPEGMVRHGPGVWKHWRRPNWIVTAAAHSPAALWRAKRAGADAALLAPVFKTSSHPEAHALGPLLFTAWSRNSPLPVCALGGVSAANVYRLAAGGCAHFAAIEALTEGPSSPP